MSESWQEARLRRRRQALEPVSAVLLLMLVIALTLWYFAP